ncbi:MAG: Na(+)-translocating NADH-quinone reductase subunit A [Dysgonamonadaceae bacterium]|jgi:Na+-transporting NADH:ubiquinone oxidoreductase subunit A|nr:Na(+)-translocating NADH-quinone reductase subunit A [Dysgonamonadaceae bacterium]
MTVKIKKGLDVKLSGSPRQTETENISSQNYAVHPDDFPGFTAKTAVKEKDTVKIGSPLLYDKYRPYMKIVSPVSGTITAVNRGEKRRLINITIHNDGKNDQIKFNTANAKTPEKIKEILAQAGLFAFIKQRPYDIIANPTDVPRDIFVSAFSSAPLAPNPDFIIKKQEEEFQCGLNTLASLTPGKIYLAINNKIKNTALRKAKNVEIVEFNGPHPAGNAGLQINRIKPINKGETVWTTDLQAVAYIGQFMKNGAIDLNRPVALTGPEVKPNERRYFKTLPGVAINEWLKNRLASDEKYLRIISGNVLTGTNIGAQGYLRYGDNCITVIPEGNNKNEFLGWISPGINKYSVSTSFISRIIDIFRRREYSIDARIKGGKRAMIMSEEWDKVFPMDDILPEYLIRAIITSNIEKMENLGIYEVAPEDFALCEFVDTSKMELQKIVREGLDKLYKEMN